ncbi:MAG: DinB family protein [Candidatus Eisenbacteria bacterium]
MAPLSPTEIRAASRRLSAVDHPGVIRSFYPYWDAQYRPYLLMAVEALPREHFDFKPRADMLTAHQTIVHIADAEHFWMRSVIEGDPEESWVVEHEEPAQGWRTVIDAPDHAALLGLLERGHRPTQRWFDRPASELGRLVTLKLPEGTERQYTLHWILDHVQEHEIHHRAQLNIYLRILGITPPGI